MLDKRSGDHEKKSSIMRIAIVRTAQKPLNLDAYNCQEIGLAKSLIRLEHHVTIYSQFTHSKQDLSNRASDKLNLVKLILSAKFKQITYYHGLVRELKNHSYDVIQVHEDSQLMSALIVNSFKNSGQRLVLYQGMYRSFEGWKGFLQKVFDYFFRKMLVDNLTLVFAKTHSANSYLVSKGYSNLHILPVGLNLPQKSSHSEFHGGVKEFAQTKQLVLTYIGVIETRRNPNFLIALLKSLLGEMEVGLIVVGDGPLRSNMKASAQESGLENNIMWIKEVRNDHVWKIYEYTDVLLLPTNYEIFGMVILEALFFGVPVVSTPEAGPMEILGSDKRLGAIVPLQLEPWVTALRQFLKDESTEVRNFRKEYLLKNFSWDVIGREYESKLKNAEE